MKQEEIQMLRILSKSILALEQQMIQLKLDFRNLYLEILKGGDQQDGNNIM